MQDPHRNLPSEVRIAPNRKDSPMEDLNISNAEVHPLVLYRNHLEFNGYRVQESDSELICIHSRKPNLIVKPISDRGVLVSTLYTFNEDISRIEVLEYTNQLNSEFIFMKAFVDEENNLIMDTFFEGEYDRTNFSILLDNIEYDMANFRDNPSTKEYLE